MAGKYSDNETQTQRTHAQHVAISCHKHLIAMGKHHFVIITIL